jgi:RNA polymerase sigma-B factor
MMTADARSVVVGEAPTDEPTDEQVAAWLRAYAERGDRDGRERVILAHLDLADRLAGRYRAGADTSPDDLRQTARVGLIGAVDRYDPGRGTPFRPYAIATIIGELKRYLRDTTWSVHLPRTVKQRALEVLGLRERIGHRGDRWPATSELAAMLDISQEEASRAVEAAETRRALSLDLPVDGRGPMPLSAVLPDPEPAVAPEDLLVLLQLLAALPPTERTVVELSYLEGRKQREIGVVLGCSQMQVSRLRRRALQRLRQQLVDDDT